MKATEKKSTFSSLPKGNQPFFQKEGEGSFFSNVQSHPDPFFSPSNLNSSFNPTRIQPKLSIGKPGDKYEQEADAMADQVVQRLSTSPSKEEEVEAAPGIQQRPQSSDLTLKPEKQKKTSTPPLIQLKPEKNREEEIQKKEEEEIIQESPQEKIADLPTPPASDGEEDDIQMQSQQSNPGFASPSLESRLNNTRGGGSPLPTHTQSEMGSAFGADFSGVRVHTDSSAVQMSKELGAQAFTHGSDVYFNEGKYNPETSSGKHLLAHELTHTVQQNPNELSRSTDSGSNNADTNTTGEETTKDVSEISESKHGKITEENGNFHIELFKFRLKSNINPGVAGSMPGPPYKLQSPDTNRATKQASVWRKGLRKTVKENLEALAGPGVKNGVKYILELKSRKSDVSMAGTISQLATASFVPFWNIHGSPMTYQIEHLIDWQLAGTSVVDHLENLILLDASTNIGLGQQVKSEKEKHIRKVLKHYNDKDAGLVTTATEALRNYRVTIDVPFNRKGIDVVGDVIPASLIKNKKSDRNPFHKDHIKIRDFEVPDNHFLLKTSKRGAGYIIPYNANGFRAGSFRVRVDGDADNHIINSLSLIPDMDSEHMSANSPEDTYEVEKLDVDVFRVVGLRNKLKNLFELKGLSPIELNEDEIDIDDSFTIRANGQVKSNISFLEDLNIGISIVGGEFNIIKVFDTSELNEKIPKPFTVENSTFEILYNSKRGLGAYGSISLLIEGVGKGTLKASADSKGNFKVGGEFDIASEMFEQSSINFEYKRTPEDNGQYSIGGKLKLGKGKVKGLKKAEADVHYENDTLSARGMAQPDVKGFDEIEMFLVIGNGGYEFGGKIDLSSISQWIKKGELELKVTDNAESEGLKIAGGGSVEPEIPGLQSGTKLTIYYDDGAILIQGKVPFTFEQARASGEVEVGITNQEVNDQNEPTGQISDSWIVFGKGLVTVDLGNGLEATASVILNREGEIIISGEVGLKQDEDDEKNKERELINKPLISINPPSVVIFVIPPIAASLKLGIEGGVDLYAYFTPPHFKELTIGLNDFNLTNPEDDFSIDGRVTVAMGARGGIEAWLKLKATLTVLVAAVEGFLKGSVGLEASADASASVGVKWSKANGLEIDDTLFEINADAKFIAKLSGGIRVFLDLWLAEIDIWEEEIEIAQKEFGPNLKVGFKLPVTSGENGLEIGDFDANSFEYPDLTSPDKQQDLVKDAVMEDDKMKPPPPPSKEEAIAAVRSLDAGPIAFWDVLTMDGDEARAKVALGWTTRDTYISWLLHKHRTLDWSDAVAVGKRRDEQDFQKLKGYFANLKMSTYYAVLKIQEFKEDHYIFTESNEARIDQLFHQIGTRVENVGQQSQVEESEEKRRSFDTNQSLPPEE